MRSIGDIQCKQHESNALKYGNNNYRINKHKEEARIFPYTCVLPHVNRRSDYYT